MGRTLRDDLRDDVAKTFLDVTHFAEMVTYIPVGGSAKSIAAIITSIVSGPENQGHSRIHARHKSFAIYDGDNVTGHVNPREGDVIEYTEAGALRRWDFAKELKHEPGLWTLEFHTSMQIAAGFNRPNGL
jgi:hypothetical protein